MYPVSVEGAIVSIIKRASFALALAAASGFAGSAGAAEVLRIGSAVFDDHSTARSIRQDFAGEVAKIAGGKYEVQVFPGSQLGGVSEAVQQVRNGTIFGCFVSTAYFNSYVPELGVTNLPFVFPSREVAFKVFDGPFGAETRQKLSDKGFTLLSYFELGFRNISNSKRAVVNPADVKGLKIRLQPNPIHMQTFSLLGANPVQIDAKEMFAAMRQGVVDGQENPFAVINLYKMDEAAQKYVSATGHFYDIMLFVGSKRVLDRMPAAERDAILAAGKSTQALQRKLAAEEDEVHSAALKQRGVEVTFLTPEQREAFRVATLPIYDKVREDLGAKVVDDFLASVKAASATN